MPPGLVRVVSVVAAGGLVAACATGSASPKPPPPLPTLGVTGAWAPSGEGFGHVEPGEISLGGDPTGVVTGIRWRSWGGGRAQGTGTSTYVSPGQDTASGTPRGVTVVAFDLGSCRGHRAYQKVTWYFPGAPTDSTFDPSSAEYTCRMGYTSSSR